MYNFEVVLIVALFSNENAVWGQVGNGLYSEVVLICKSVRLYCTVECEQLMKFHCKM